MVMKGYFVDVVSYYVDEVLSLKRVRQGSSERK